MVFRKTGETKQLGLIEPKPASTSKPEEKTSHTAQDLSSSESESERRLRLLKSNAIGR